MTCKCRSIPKADPGNHRSACQGVSKAPFFVGGLTEGIPIAVRARPWLPCHQRTDQKASIPLTLLGPRLCRQGQLPFDLREAIELTYYAQVHLGLLRKGAELAFGSY
jgi:hypothetical protein